MNSSVPLPHRPATGGAADLLDSDLPRVRAHLAAAFATRSVPAMWECCRDEAALLGDVDRLTAEVGRLRHDFAVISDDLDQATNDHAALARETRNLTARLNAARVRRRALELHSARLTRLLGAELTGELDKARTLARIADADHARLIRHARAAVATGNLGYLAAELGRRGLTPDTGSPAAVLAAPMPIHPAPEAPAAARIPGQRAPIEEVAP